MTTVLLDTHVLYWWSSESSRLSRTAGQALESADELAVASITWYELAWLVQHDKITIHVPLLTWLKSLATQVATVATTPAVAATAVSLPATFPRDPADRIIYATAIEYSWPLITIDERMRQHQHPRQITVW